MDYIWRFCLSAFRCCFHLLFSVRVSSLLPGWRYTNSGGSRRVQPIIAATFAKLEKATNPPRLWHQGASRLRARLPGGGLKGPSADKSVEYSRQRRYNHGIPPTRLIVGWLRKQRRLSSQACTAWRVYTSYWPMFDRHQRLGPRSSIGDCMGEVR